MFFLFLSVPVFSPWVYSVHGGSLLRLGGTWRDQVLSRFIGSFFGIYKEPSLCFSWECILKSAAWEQPVHNVPDELHLHYAGLSLNLFSFFNRSVFECRRFNDTMYALLWQILFVKTVVSMRQKNNSIVSRNCVCCGCHLWTHHVEIIHILPYPI